MALIPLIALVLIGYLFLVRPQRRQVRQRSEMVRSVGVGAEIQTIGGIIGRIVGSEDDLIKLEVSPGVVMTFVRAAIARVIEAPPSDEFTDEGFGDHAEDSVPDTWSSGTDAGEHDAPTEPGEDEAV